MSTPEPQSILEQPTSSAIFLVLVAEPGHEDEIRDFLAEINGLQVARSASACRRRD